MDAFKTEICLHWVNGNCRHGHACRYAHGLDELRVRTVHELKYKTSLCNNFEVGGTCRYSFKCKFAHGAGELLQRGEGLGRVIRPSVPAPVIRPDVPVTRPVIRPNVPALRPVIAPALPAMDRDAYGVPRTHYSRYLAILAAFASVPDLP